ncbi:transposable element Tcb2 transposase [Trichonephila clavipes]|nr:transposable element Tcb2 transposase [Trichonephila clavipes]
MQIRQPKLLEKYPRLKSFVDKVSSNEVVSHFIETELAPSAVLRKNSISERPSDVSDKVLCSMIKTNPTLTSSKVAFKLVIHQTALDYAKRLSFVPKPSVWEPHELSAKNLMNKISVCSSNLARHKRNPFLEHLVTGDEKWMVYKHVVIKKSIYLQKGHPPPHPHPKLASIRRRHLDAFTRGRIIGKLEEGRSVTSVAAEFGIAHSIVSRLWRQFQTTGTAIRGFSSGRPRGITPADDRYIVLQARRNRRQTAGEIARHTTQATGRPISRFTVARRLHGGGLFAQLPVRCVPLTPDHRRRRSLWCREHRNWRDNEWGRVLFTDESRFSLSSDFHRILIWRERGSRNHPSNIIERDRYGGGGVLVWGGIMLCSRTDLHIFDAGSVNGTRYCNEILLPYVRLFRGDMGLQFLFMDDNAPCHRTVAAEQLLESEDIERMDWPARSPDLNPIEHVWYFLGRRLAARTLPPVTIRELRLALQDEWAAMPQQLIDTLILSMGRRCETCLAVRGDHIPY